MDKDGAKYILCNTDGIFEGFFDNEDIVKEKCQDGGYIYRPITEEIKLYLLSEVLSDNRASTQPIIDVNSPEDELISEKSQILEFTEEQFNIKMYHDRAKETLFDKEKMFIEDGIDFEIDGVVKHYTYTVEDRLNIESILKKHKPGDTIYYRAKDEYAMPMEYSTLESIYKALEDHRLFNQIYTDCTIEWMMKNFTEDLFLEKQDVIVYGYCNDEINQMMAARLESEGVEI